MIRVCLYKNNEGYIDRYSIKGHAGHDVKGQDIVCAGVSVLAQTALISLVKICGIKEDEVHYIIDEDEGILDVTLPDLDMDIRNKTEIVLKTLEIGIISIVENYPEYVTLIYREV
ncbi:MAG: ribosomal-processing cysteine protease Prp [Tissierellia bacterium]|nr:ribosomal-processing cysteine protease Prp [Tissierellia bacterium]